MRIDDPLKSLQALFWNKDLKEFRVCERGRRWLQREERPRTVQFLMTGCEEVFLKKTVFIIILSCLFLSACAPVGPAGEVQPLPERKNSLALIAVNEGLPRDGQWRENIVLADMNGDGLLDIVAPPARAAEKEKNRPSIFLRDKEGWKEGDFDFPPLKEYGYGGIAAGDITRDGRPDLVLAVHQGKLIILENNGSSGFVERAFPGKEKFHSRAVELNDMNGDGRQDIIALSESPFDASMVKEPKGILIGSAKEGNAWEVRIVEASAALFGDSLAIGDFRGTGNKDIAIAPLVFKKREKAKLIWFGNGKGDFSLYDGDLIKETIASYVRAGDLKGDGKDEVVFRVSGFGKTARSFLSAFEWTGTGFADISKGLEQIEDPVVFDLSDVDRDGKKELVVLSTSGIEIYKHIDNAWVERGFYRLSHAETAGAADLKAGRNRDGSLLIAYNLGRTESGLNRGIRAYLLK
jgi:hypothetical protein